VYTKDIVNDQSADGDHLDELRRHFAVLKEAVNRLGFHLGLESGSCPSGAAGAGSQDGIKYHKDPELALADMRQQLRAARETAARRGVKVRN
jgi:hypothetical protein